MSIDKGMFNFQSVMDQFYNWQPKEGDDTGRAMKNSFMTNMIQSGFDANVAKDMAYAQSGIAKSNMTHAADLELRNKTALMNEEFNKGMMSMGGQFEFQNRFAEDQNVRDITQNTTNTAAGFEFGDKAAGNQNVRDINRGSIERADNFEYANQGAENQSVRDVNKETAMAGANFEYADKMADNQNIRDMAKMGFQGDDYRKSVAAQGEQERYGMMQQGAENRETMREGDRIEAGKQNRQSARARATARAF